MKYRIVCNEHDVFHVETMMKTDQGKLFWTNVYRCKEKHEAGYKEARAWIEKQLSTPKPT